MKVNVLKIMLCLGEQSSNRSDEIWSKRAFEIQRQNLLLFKAAVIIKGVYGIKKGNSLENIKPLINIYSAEVGCTGMIRCQLVYIK